MIPCSCDIRNFRRRIAASRPNLMSWRRSAIFASNASVCYWVTLNIATLSPRRNNIIPHRNDASSECVGTASSSWGFVASSKPHHEGWWYRDISFRQTDLMARGATLWFKDRFAKMSFCKYILLILLLFFEVIRSMMFTCSLGLILPIPLTFSRIRRYALLYASFGWGFRGYMSKSVNYEF